MGRSPLESQDRDSEKSPPRRVEPGRTARCCDSRSRGLHLCTVVPMSDAVPLTKNTSLAPKFFEQSRRSHARQPSSTSYVYPPAYAPLPHGGPRGAGMTLELESVSGCESEGLRQYPGGHQMGMNATPHRTGVAELLRPLS